MVTIIQSMRNEVKLNINYLLEKHYHKSIQQDLEELHLWIKQYIVQDELLIFNWYMEGKTLWDWLEVDIKF